MKKISLITLLATYSLTALAQWSGPTPGNIYYNQGNVGVGTISPQTLFQVGDGGNNAASKLSVIGNKVVGFTSFGNMYSTNSYDVASFGRRDAGHEVSAIKLVTMTSGSSTQGARIAFLNSSVSSVTSPTLKFMVGGGAGTDVLNLLSNGNVGIGTASPQAQLEIVSSAAYTAHEGNSFVIRSSNSPSPNDSRMLGMTITLDGSSNVSSSSQKSVGLFAQSAGNWSNDVDMLFYTRGSNQAPYFSEKMRIKSNGRVGIGTSAPDDALEVVGGITATGLSRGTSSAAWGSLASKPVYSLLAGRVDGNLNSLHGFGVVKTTHFESPFIYGYNMPGNKIVFGSVTSGDRNPATGLTPRMLVDLNSGNVGIGTETPQSKLAVNGQIRATEVKVLADISVPDYVFEPDYELRTLEETKEYIAKNKHLPEIPSAAEIGENGIDLGDMNMKLLKKIEELTLYQIELMEKLEKQNVELQEVKKEVQALKE